VPSDLPPDAVQILYPVLLIVGATVTLFGTLIGGLAVGFRWLRREIREVGLELQAPLVERVALVEKTADAAHRRIDEWMGARK